MLEINESIHRVFTLNILFKNKSTKQKYEVLCTPAQYSALFLMFQNYNVPIVTTS
jgi:hypothetical protein